MEISKDDLFRYVQPEVTAETVGTISASFIRDSFTTTKEADMEIWEYFIVDKDEDVILQHGHMVGEDKDEALVEIGALHGNLATKPNCEVLINKRGEYDK